MIKKIRLQNFRSYKDKTLIFGSGINVIVGPNAAGKTNILEAILVSRKGGSYRAKDIDLISFNKEWSRIEYFEENNQRTIKIEKNKLPTKIIEIGSKKYKRIPPSLRTPTVIFEPNHLQLLSGSPEKRRSYLDSLLEQTNYEYGALINKYIRTLAQRNKLLKSQNFALKEYFFPWNIRLSQLGGQIVKLRQEMVDKINTKIPRIYINISGGGIETSIRYISQLPQEDYESNLLKKLEINLNNDKKIGFTYYGPHRDDIVFLFNGHSSNTYASRGELRSAVLSLKVSEFEIIKDKINVSPVMLLDDVYSELDNKRRESLTKYLENQQTFITTTDADLIKKHQNKMIKIINL
jgi:DNA replication and repair protein RecF